MSKRLLLAFMVTAVIVLAAGGPQAAYAANVLSNGDFEDPGTWGTGSYGTLAPYWSMTNGGASWIWSKEIMNCHGTMAQKVGKTTTNTGNWGCVYQTVSANVGDAFTLGDAWVYTVADSTKTKATVRVDWTGAAPVTATPIWATAAQAANTWYEFTSHPAGNATSTNVTFSFDTRLAGVVGGTDISATWDDLAVYRAYVPPAPSLSYPTSHSLRVDVNPGGNVENALAQYAITTGSNNWVQADGSVGTTPVWQTDAAWGIETVTGLLPDTDYTFEVKARYSNTLTQATILQGLTNQIIGHTLDIPEPATMGFLALGGLAMLRRRR